MGKRQVAPPLPERDIYVKLILIAAVKSIIGTVVLCAAARIGTADTFDTALFLLNYITHCQGDDGH